MASSRPASPGIQPQRPVSAMVRPAPRSTSRLSMSSAKAGGSRASDEDGKTSVKVAVRVRPPLKSTDPGFDLIPQRFQRSMVQVQSNTGLAIDSPQGRKLFVFDRVFSPDVEQEGIWEYLSECVNAFTQGYNVSLLAYGQSGAGKSYTMGTSGPLEQDDLDAMGVIPRAATALFEKLDGPKTNPNRSSMSQLRTPARYSQQAASSRNAEKNWVLKATYVEIYNEQLRDLLVPEHTPAHERGTVTIREDVKGNIILTGLQQVEIHSVEDLMNALNQGSTLRQTDATAINARSSRSHAVFSLNLVQRKSKTTTPAERRYSVPVEAMTGTETWVTTDSKMHFVDLAGSERLKNTGAQGERAKEGISINAGLASLGKVISQLSSRQAGAHVSYRDSKLTRLLQDSLGGNAITYMIACVTPAEFHLSETLNTVQYAQRARAIQSKPRIQQVEEGDKQAIIDRLKAEVAFLREQIRSADHNGGERRVMSTGERSERQGEREAELQDQLLDAQENYTTLSQRHAKLIAEMAKARDNEAAGDDQTYEDSLGDSATERLNRSNSFAQAVEQVVLEYEKTIQSLEHSLSSTRTTLSNVETTLLEKESKCAYTETINTQLQARLQKMMDREASTESYLHDLEAKLNGHTSGEEKNATITMELRKEIARIRENEASCEDYISTLEERLAEADQDAELMQREIDRLEQVVERQRSLGKLDSLLYELDNIQQDAKVPVPAPELPEVERNGAGEGHRRTASRKIADHSRSQSHASRSSHLEETIPESGEEDIPEEDEQKPHAPDATESNEASPGEDVSLTNTSSEYQVNPAQSRYVADKLETVTQELLDLRVEHEGTRYEYDLLHAKYDEALRALAELQDVVDEARHPRRPRDSMLSVPSPTSPSFLSDSRSSEVGKDGVRSSLSRSLSSELSSAMESPATILEASDGEAVTKPDQMTPKASDENQDPLATEIERLKTVAASKEAAEIELALRYDQLKEAHQDTLDMVEELKTEIAKAQAGVPEASSPRTSTPVIRRKSSQNVMIIDRAHRSFASLRNIATENFEDQPDVMQNFELNLNAAMHELHARSERIQELEADVTAAKKEMETKMTIISGLTRERSSLKASPMDMAVVSNLREQLGKNEKQLRAMQDAHTAREKELEVQLEELKQSLEATKTQAAESQAEDAAAATQREVHEAKIAELETELASWESKHKAALDGMQATEEQMKKSVEALETQVAALNAQLADHESQAVRGEETKAAEAKHESMIHLLRNEINEYKAIINSSKAKVAEIEEEHAATRKQLETATAEHGAVLRERDLATGEATAHKDLVAKLELTIADHEQAIKSHAQSLQELQDKHALELTNIQASSKQDHEEQLAALQAGHAQNVKDLESDLAETREELMKIATQVAFALNLDVSVDKISERIEDLIADQQELSKEQRRRQELEAHLDDLSTINETVMRDLESVKASLRELLSNDGELPKSATLADQMKAVKKKLVELENRNKKNSRLVEELEDQLQNNFDQVQMTTNRLSTLQSERQVQLEEAHAGKLKYQAEAEALREEYAILQARYENVVNAEAQRGGAMSPSGLRKSSSVASLPSPPPAIPLPPLPSASSPIPGQGPTSPTGRPPSKDLAAAQIQQDQEHRIEAITRQLDAEKQLTATLEEALTDLENTQKKIKTDCDAWRRRANDLELELKDIKEKPQQDNRWSLQQVEEERRKRRETEVAMAHLEARMQTNNKKKKKGSLNCF